MSWESHWFGRVELQLRRIWSRTHLNFDPQTSGPRLPVPLDKRSPWTNGPQQIRSPWTNGPQPIRSPYFWIPTACPPVQTEYSRDHLSRGTKLVGDHLSMGTKFLVTICPWGLLIQRDQLIGDPLWGPNVRGPYAFGTKCVTAEFWIFVVMFSSIKQVHLKKSKQIFDILKPKFDMLKSMSHQGHYTHQLHNLWHFFSNKWAKDNYAAFLLLFCVLHRYISIKYLSMTQLSSHTFAHLTGSSFRLKAKLLPNKNV